MKTSALVQSVDVTAIPAKVTQEPKGSGGQGGACHAGAFRQAMASVASAARGVEAAPPSPSSVRGASSGGFYGELLPNVPASSFEVPLGSSVSQPAVRPRSQATPVVPATVERRSTEVALVPPRPPAPQLELPPQGATEPTKVEEVQSTPPSDDSLALPPALSQPVFEGLRMGDRGGETGARVERLQGVLSRWNPRLDVGPKGCYTQRTADALTLYKVVYGSGTNGQSVDAHTAENLARMEDGTFWRNPPAKSTGGEILYHASRDLGVPYVMGGDGTRSTDCGMLTRRAVVNAGLADSTFSRLADVQYYYAERGLKGLQLRSGEPKAGDLVFFTNPTRQSSQAYQGVTHVGLYVGDGRILAASSGRGRVVMQSLGGLGRYVKGFACFQGNTGPVAQVP